MFQEGIEVYSKTRYVISATFTTMSYYDAGQTSPRVTICSLPDDILLDIFELFISNWLDRELQAWAWTELLHVCQRWRYIVFASPLRLDLCLVCTGRTSVRKTLDVWPPLPIEIACFSVDLRVEDNIIAALAHPNRTQHFAR
jgi:F-box-like